MSAEANEISYKTYWITWAGLLVLTVVMIVADGAALPRAILLLVLLGAMLVKAGFILGIFMHLRFERVLLVSIVLVSIFVVGLILFGGVAPDGFRQLYLRN